MGQSAFCASWVSLFDYFQDLLVAMKALGLNPTETEIQDLINEVERNGFIYYPAFCRVIMRKLREDDEENFRRELFRTMVGPKKYDGMPAPVYNYNREVLTFEQVSSLMISIRQGLLSLQGYLHHLQIIFCFLHCFPSHFCKLVKNINGESLIISKTYPQYFDFLSFLFT